MSSSEMFESQPTREESEVLASTGSTILDGIAARQLNK